MWFGGGGEGDGGGGYFLSCDGLLSSPLRRRRAVARDDSSAEGGCGSSWQQPTRISKCEKSSVSKRASWHALVGGLVAPMQRLSALTSAATIRQVAHSVGREGEGAGYGGNKAKVHLEPSVFKAPK